MLTRRARELLIRVWTAKCHASKRETTTAVLNAVLQTIATVEAFHKRESNWTIIKLLPIGGFDYLYCLRATLHVVNLPISLADGTRVKAATCPQCAAYWPTFALAGGPVPSLFLLPQARLG